MSRASSAREPVRAAWTIHQVLDRYPHLLETLVPLSPAFTKLRNPVLRSVQSRLMTVAQAARIAQLEPTELVRRLNAAAGIPGAGEPAPARDEAAEPGAPPAPPPEAFASAPVAVTVDARPLIQRGEEPFPTIMAAAVQTPVGQVLRLLAPFEPVPLYDVLGKRGFAHQRRRLESDTWEVLFLRMTPAPQLEPPVASAAAQGTSPSSTHDTAADATPAAVVTIDVSDLVPPEPMVRILRALEELAPGQMLLVHHVRRPVYLYPQLDALGYQHETREIGPGQVELRIRKPAPDRGTAP